MSKSNLRQVGGNHYGGGAKQHWDFVVQNLKGRYLEGNISRYVDRYRQKNGLEDLQKALHYAQKLREEYAAGRVAPMNDGDMDRIGGAVAWSNSRGHSFHQGRVMSTLAIWSTHYELDALQVHIQRLIDELSAALVKKTYEERESDLDNRDQENWNDTSAELTTFDTPLEAQKEVDRVSEIYGTVGGVELRDADDRGSDGPSYEEPFDDWCPAAR